MCRHQCHGDQLRGDLPGVADGHPGDLPQHLPHRGPGLVSPRLQRPGHLPECRVLALLGGPMQRQRVPPPGSAALCNIPAFALDAALTWCSTSASAGTRRWSRASPARRRQRSRRGSATAARSRSRPRPPPAAATAPRTRPPRTWWVCCGKGAGVHKLAGHSRRAAWPAGVRGLCGWCASPLLTAACARRPT